MGPAISAEQARERIDSALDAIDAAHDLLRDTPSDLVGNRFRVDVAARLETQERANRGLMYRIFAEIADPPDETGSIAQMRSVLWKRLRITPERNHPTIQARSSDSAAPVVDRPAAATRVADLAAAVDAGAVGDDHIRAICRAIDVLPGCVSPIDAQAPNARWSSMRPKSMRESS